jgi:hypothetical protein
MQSRPFIEEHDKMFRWYDYWIKGIDNGVMAIYRDATHQSRLVLPLTARKAVDEAK